MYGLLCLKNIRTHGNANRSPKRSVLLLTLTVEGTQFYLAQGRLAGKLYFQHQGIEAGDSQKLKLIMGLLIWKFETEGFGGDH